jgi:tetratricopeptide (TPR) repeat protein
LSQRSGAIAAFDRAVAIVPNRGDWWYRLGRLQLDNGHRAEALAALVQATELGDPVDPPPSWLADAHRIRGNALRLGGDRANALIHYRRYMQLAPSTAIDRGEVSDWISRLGG